MTEGPRDGDPPPFDPDATTQIPQPGDAPADPGALSDPGAPVASWPEEPAPQPPGPAAPEPQAPGPEAPEQELEAQDPRPAWLIPATSAAGALVAGLLLGWLVWSGGDDDSELQAEVDGLTAEVDALTSENDDLRGEVEGLTGDLEAAQQAGEDSLAELTSENEDLASQVDSLTEEVEGLTTDNEDLTGQVASLEEENARLEGHIEEIMADIDAAVVSVPDVGGSTVDFVTSLAEEHGWVLVQTPAATDEAAPGTVVAQQPPAGTPMLEGSALVISVATEPEPPPEPDAEIETVFEGSGTGPGTTDAVDLVGGTRHVLAYSFSGEGRHTVTVVDADDKPVAVLADVNGSTEGAIGLPLAGNYRLQVDTEDTVEWTLRVVALP